MICQKFKTERLAFCFDFRPLQRIGWGMFLAATTFLMTAFLQIAIDVRNVLIF